MPSAIMVVHAHAACLTWRYLAAEELVWDAPQQEVSKVAVADSSAPQSSLLPLLPLAPMTTRGGTRVRQEPGSEASGPGRAANSAGSTRGDDGDTGMCISLRRHVCAGHRTLHTSCQTTFRQVLRPGKCLGNDCIAVSSSSRLRLLAGAAQTGLLWSAEAAACQPPAEGLKVRLRRPKRPAPEPDDKAADFTGRRPTADAAGTQADSQVVKKPKPEQKSGGAPVVAALT